MATQVLPVGSGTRLGRQWGTLSYSVGNNPEDPMTCHCGNGAKVQDFIRSKIATQELGNIYICAKCGTLQVSKVALVNHVLETGVVGEPNNTKDSSSEFPTF